MANPIGEDSWLAYVDEESRHATDLEARVKVVELFKKAILAEPGSLKIWLAYCEWFWSLFTDCQSSEAGWPEEEQQLGRELFSFDAALSLWSEGYEAIKYRLNDSDRFWNRWVSIEQEQLARTRTPVGVKRITHLFRDRLQIPHATWDNTSQMFSSFLSTYNNAAYESEFKEVTASAQEAKGAYEQREPFELKLNSAARSGNTEEQKTIMKEYLDWEMIQSRKKHTNPTMAFGICLSLFSRALGSLLGFDEDTWTDYIIHLSTLQDIAKTTSIQVAIPDKLNVLQRAVSHCPGSGMLWSRYILSAEEAGWAFHDVEHIKHAATNTKELDKNGMTGVIDMYAAWCGYLKRTAMNPNAPEDAVDIADVGLLAALEDVQLWGERLYKDAYRGDPNYRLERILIQYLREKKGEIDQARHMWNRMAEKPLLADSYDFWVNYYLWEMIIFSSQQAQRSPTPATPANGVKPIRAPSLATDVLARALQRKTLDWPERIMEVYHQHCNDYEQPEMLHRAIDAIYKARKAVAKRREREQVNAAAAYAVQMQAQQQTPTEETSMRDSPSGSKRKRETTPEESANPATKRPKQNVNGTDSTTAEQKLKRDRENTTVMVTNLPADTSVTSIRKYFKDYGNAMNATRRTEKDGSVSALVEFETPDEMQSALLRDQKYFGQSQISVSPGTGLTIYVSNYPPTADEKYIRELYKDCGEIFGIRFPSLKFNAHRRFCYISFCTQEGAEKASHLDGKLIEGKYKLQSKYSNPTRKKNREGALAEGREICIKNLDHKVTEKELQNLLEKYGTVQSVRILTNMGNKSLGTAYAVFEAKEQAEQALELDKTKFKFRILEVQLARETNFKPFATSKGGSMSAASSPAPDADADVGMTEDGEKSGTSQNRGPSKKDIQERTMALMNIPDTVNDARVRELAERSGEIAKLVLRYDHQGAIIEYRDKTTMARAMLELSGVEIEPGRKLRTGTTTELFKQKAEMRIDRIVPGAGSAKEKGKDKGAGGSKDKSKSGFMPPPQHIKRPALGAKSGKRAGLGFVAAKRDATEKKENDSPAGVNGTGAAAVKPKSNADFKAMFLGGGENKDAE